MGHNTIQQATHLTDTVIVQCRLATKGKSDKLTTHTMMVLVNLGGEIDTCPVKSISPGNVFALFIKWETE